MKRFAFLDIDEPLELLKSALLVFVVCLVTAFAVVNWSGAPEEQLSVGDVAPRTVKATHTFQFLDQADREARIEAAREQERPVYVFSAATTERVKQRVAIAFQSGRAAFEADDAPSIGAVASEFRANLGVHVADDDMLALFEARFPAEAEALAVGLVERGLQGYVLDGDASALPSGPIRLVEGPGEVGHEIDAASLGRVRLLREVREQVRLDLLEARTGAPWEQAVGAVVRGGLRANLAFDPVETRARQDVAAATIAAQMATIKRGTTLFRAGDVLRPADVVRYEALQASHAGESVLVEIVAVTFFLLFLLASLYHFASAYLPGFSRDRRDAAAAGVMLVLIACLARVAVLAGEAVEASDFDVDPTALWFVVPMGGAAMLVRLLAGVGWGVVFSVVAASVCGLTMDLQAVPILYFIVSGIVGAGAVEHTRERMAVVRGGLFTGLVGAATALLLHFVQVYLGNGEVVSVLTAQRPLWSIVAALMSGLLSTFLVLGLLPVFETFGFVTDYRMMELANLNHPLLRQLMLRAPGTYHHSVVVGSLAEAACEAIGANALQARVSAYFHDIGKSLRPQFFVENQRDGVNRHDGLDPRASAQILIHHVTDGAKMAREHRLPKPIIDNILMHHGTGLIQLFYTRAAEDAAARGETVNEADFRYPGPMPDSREAGVVMLADKVEAATRTIKHPTEENLRAMISRIVSSVIADGQFSKCPLTVEEIYTAADTFVRVLLGIYHHRIEYPSTRDLSEMPRRATGTVITLDLPAVPSTEVPVPPAQDYESVDHLPGS